MLGEENGASNSVIVPWRDTASPSPAGRSATQMCESLLRSVVAKTSAAPRARPRNIYSNETNNK